MKCCEYGPCCRIHDTSFSLELITDDIQQCAQCVDMEVEGGAIDNLEEPIKIYINMLIKMLANQKREGMMERWLCQGTLTKGVGSVQLTSLYFLIYISSFFC